MLRHRLLTIVVAYGLLIAAFVGFWPILRREFFPEVDAGSFEMYVRAPSGLRIEETEKRIKAVEEFVRKTIERGRPAARPLRDRRDFRLVGRLHAQRRPDGCRGQDPVDRGTDEIGPGVRPHPADRVQRTTRVQRPRVRLRCRRHGPLGDERRQVDADQRPGHRQGPGDRAQDRHGDQERGARRSTAWSTRGSSSGSNYPAVRDQGRPRPRRPSWGCRRKT